VVAPDPKSGWYYTHSRGVLLSLGLLGIALIVVSREIASRPLGDVGSSLGDAAIVSAVIGGLIERPLKRKFALEIAKDVFLTLFGVSAPSEYVRALEAVCRTDRLSYGVTWDITFTWFVPGEILQVTMQARNSLLNIGSKSWVPSDLWLMASVAQSPGSHFEQYEADITPSEGAPTRIPSKTKHELLEVQSRPAEDGSISIESSRLLQGHADILPGYSLRISMTGVAYLRPTGMIPLIHSYPSMKTSLILRGDALQDIVLRLHNGTALLEPSIDTDGSIKYVDDTLTMPGSTIRVGYDIRESYLSRLLAVNSL
jgi:hypothetical protein